MNMRYNKLKNWEINDRPQEKMYKNGPTSLSNAELLAIILRTGTRNNNILDITRSITSKYPSFRQISQVSTTLMDNVEGIGLAKQAQIIAVLEICKRFSEEEILNRNKQIKSSKDAFTLLSSRMRDLKKEIFEIILLDSENRVIKTKTITKGTTNKAYPIIKEVFHPAINHCASGIICAHNHPSGNPTPSKSDLSFTYELRKIATTLDINLLDHLIIGRNTYFSFKDEEEL